jgi:integrase
MTDIAADRVMLTSYAKSPGASVGEARARHRRSSLPCVPNLYTQRFTLAEARAILDDPVRDKRYLETTLGPEIEAHLRWLRLSNCSPKTLRARLHILARLAVSLPAGVGIAEIAYEHLELYFADEVPEGSWRTHRSHINQFLQWGIDTEPPKRAAKNPMRRLPKLRPTGKRVYNVFNDRERELILDASRYMDDPPRELVRAHLLLDAGIRKAEAQLLRNSDVDPGRRQITVTGKGDKQRVIPIHGNFWLAWERHLLEPYPKLGRLPEPDDYVWFPARVAGAYKERARQITAEYPERPMLERGFHDWWRRLMSHISVEYRRPHMTRHTFGTDAVDASEGDIYGVQQLMGHESIRTTELYLHSSTKRKESVAAKLARARRIVDEFGNGPESDG